MRRREFLLALGAAPLAGVTAEPASRAFELAIAKGRVDAAQETVRVKKGDKVELRWTSDRRIALHLHGYDIETTVTPRTPGGDVLPGAHRRPLSRVRARAGLASRAAGLVLGSAPLAALRTASASASTCRCRCGSG
jgi:hypothetical protein